MFRTGSELIALSGTIGRHLAELLRHYNSRCCQLVLGAEAMQVAGLKTITSTILVLAARSLKLILWFMPFVKSHFQSEFNFTRAALSSQQDINVSICVNRSCGAKS